MYIKLKHVQPLGYEGTDIFSSAFHWIYKKEFPDKRAFVIINNHDPQSIEVFKLSPVEYRKYKKNKLGLCPSGCAGGLTGKESVNSHVMWSGGFKTSKQMRELLRCVEGLI